MRKPGRKSPRPEWSRTEMVPEQQIQEADDCRLMEFDVEDEMKKCFLLLGFIGVFLVIALTPSMAGREKANVTVLFSSNVYGEVEPCG